jgi:hypothetical protein
MGAGVPNFRLATIRELTCDSQDLTLQAILSNGVALVRQTLAGCSAEWLLIGRRKGASLCYDLVTSTII